MIFPYMKKNSDLLLLFFNIFFVLLIINLISDNLGYFNQSFVVLISVFLFISLFIINIPFRKLLDFTLNKRKRSNLNIFGLIFILFSFLIFLSTNKIFIQISAIPIFLFGLDILLRGIKIRRNEICILAITSFLYGIFFVIVNSISFVWYLTQQSSLVISNIIGKLSGNEILFGPSISGFYILISFIFLLIVCFFKSNKNKSDILKIGFFRFGFFVIWIFYIYFLSISGFEPKNDISNYLFVFFFINSILAFIYYSKIHIKDFKTTLFDIKKSNVRKIVKNATFLSLILLFISGVLLTIYTPSEHSNSQNILFYADEMIGTWDIPAYGEYGKDAAGMFGLLPIYLSSSNYQCSLLVTNKTNFLNINQPEDENITRFVNLTDNVQIYESEKITRNLLENIDIFVVISINTSFNSDEKKIIWEFVKSGGSLLVIGDHTNIGGIRNPLNHLLKPSKISFRFDSALPFDENLGWETCIQLPHNILGSYVKIFNDVQINVGASLDIEYPAYPVIIGNYALSDAGNIENKEFAYLGDYEYNDGEQLGDLILVATSNYGAGKVLVFGDSSTFQNSAIPHSYNFIEGIFNWMKSGTNSNLELLKSIVSILFLIASFLIYYIAKSTKIKFHIIPIVFCFSLILTSLINPIFVENSKINGNIVYADNTHNEKMNLEPFKENSISGLFLNLNRNGYLPLFLDDFSEENIVKSKILIFNTPTKTFSNEEVNTILRFMSKGCYVILSTGYEEKSAVKPLLKKLDLDIENIPLGPLPYVGENISKYENEPRFVNSWPIVFKEGQVTSFYNITFGSETYHTVVLKKYGEGGLLLISDSEFLLDKNIESIFDYWPGNILFLKSLIEQIEGGDI